MRQHLEKSKELSNSRPTKWSTDEATKPYTDFFFLMHWYQSLTTDVQERRHTDLNSHCNWFKSYYLMEAKGNNQQVSKKAIKRAPPPRFRELHIYVLLDFLHILQSKLYITMDSWLKEVWESCLLLRLKWICHHLYVCSWMLIFIQILFQ